jgi:hypothetical protein
VSPAILVNSRINLRYFDLTLFCCPNIFHYFIRHRETWLIPGNDISDLICRNANGGEIQKPNKINVLTF